MQHDELALLRSSSPAWRPLRADNAPLILSFLDRVFAGDERAATGSNVAKLRYRFTIAGDYKGFPRCYCVDDRPF